jgi:hypothetical protein
MKVPNYGLWLIGVAIAVVVALALGVRVGTLAFLGVALMCPLMCPLMMLLMMRGVHGGGESHEKGSTELRRSDDHTHVH